MDLKTLLGSAYKEGMTLEEINAALSNKKIADLESGAYVLKEKADADLRNEKAEIQRLKAELDAKMTDEEKAKQTQAEKDKALEALQKQIVEMKTSANKSKIEASLAEMKSKLEIKDDDKDFQNFVSTITTEDETKTATISAYLSKFLKQVYDKGVADATKAAIGKNNSLNNSGSNNNPNDIKDDLGSRLAKANKLTDGAKTYNYFN